MRMFDLARRIGLSVANAALASLLAASAAQALDWPTRTVTIVVPYAPAGQTDVMARFLAQKLTEKYGKPFVVENKGGASGALGTAYVARSAPDGYTILFAGAVQTIIVPMLQKVAYDPEKDLVPTNIFGTGYYVLGAKKSLPANTLPEFIAYAKANPGKLDYASVGPGGIVHLGTELMLKQAGISVQHIPYNGTMAAGALMSGDVDIYLGTAAEMIAAGTTKMKFLASSNLKRLDQLPDLPTMSETLPGLRVSSWNGFFLPTGTPKEIVDALVRDTAEIAKEPAMAARLVSLGIDPIGNTNAEMMETFRAEQKRYREAVIAAGLLKE